MKPVIVSVLPSPLALAATEQEVTVIGSGIKQDDNLGFYPNDYNQITNPTTQGYNGPLYDIAPDGTSAKATIDFRGNVALWQVQIISPYTDEQSNVLMVNTVAGDAYVGHPELDTLARQQAAWQAALGRGHTLLGDGREVPTEFLKYNVVFPDGIAYAVVSNVPGMQTDQVLRWESPSYVPLQVGSFVERGGVTDCTGIVKGTGNWYEEGALGMLTRGGSCDSTPDSFNGDYSLLTPAIRASLFPGNPGIQNNPSPAPAPIPPINQQPAGPAPQQSQPPVGGSPTLPATPGQPITNNLPAGSSGGAGGGAASSGWSSLAVASKWAIVAAVVTIAAGLYSIFSRKRGK